MEFQDGILESDYNGSNFHSHTINDLFCEPIFGWFTTTTCAIVCVCVCERERERESVCVCMLQWGISNIIIIYYTYASFLSRSECLFLGASFLLVETSMDTVPIYYKKMSH